MDAKDYLERIAAAYLGEVYGERLFEAMAAGCPDAGRRHKLTVLAQLERETKEALRPLVARLGGDTREDPERQAQGTADGTAFAKMEWEALMRRYQERVPRFLPGFETLEAEAPEGDRAILHRLTEHSRAFGAFVELELSGRGADSLAPVLARLQGPPPEA